MDLQVVLAALKQSRALRDKAAEQGHQEMTAVWNDTATFWLLKARTLLAQQRGRKSRSEGGPALLARLG